MRPLMLPICWLLLIPVAGSAAPPSFESIVLSDAPLLYYRFDEPSGDVTNRGTLGSAFDATVFGTVTRSVPTLGEDTGLGVDSVDDYLESQAVAPVGLTGNPTFSAEVVYMVPTTGGAVGWAPFLHWGPSNSPPAMRSVYFSFSQNAADEIYAGFYQGGLQTQDPVPLGEWHHVVWLRTGGGAANAGTVVYLDGVAVSLEDDPGLPLNSATPVVEATEFRINRARDFTRFFIGTIDELALYDRLLTQQEVELHYLALLARVPALRHEALALLVLLLLGATLLAPALSRRRG